MKIYERNKERGGIEISITKSGNLKVFEWSVYSDVKDITYYVKPDADFNAETNWDEVVNEYGMTKASILKYQGNIVMP